MSIELSYVSSVSWVATLVEDFVSVFDLCILVDHAVAKPAAELGLRFLQGIVQLPVVNVFVVDEVVGHL